MLTKKCVQCGKPFLSAYPNRKCCSTVCADIRSGKRRFEKESKPQRLRFITTPNGLEVIDNCFGQYMADNHRFSQTIKPIVSRTLFRFKKHGSPV